MHSSLIAILFIGIAVALPTQRQETFLNGISRLSADDGFYVPQLPDGLIVGGNETAPHDYPWQVGLFMDFGAFCGGSVIDEEWILTAAHCIVNAESVEVVMGAHYILEFEDTQQRQVSFELTSHENYNGLLKRNDVGIIRLPTPVVFDEYVQKIAITNSEPEADTLVMLTGWGVYNDSIGEISDVLREVAVEIMDDDTCSRIMGTTFNYNEIICLKGADDKGSCSGDSGGPLNFDEEQNGQYVVAGTCAFGLRFGCENEFPKAYSSTFFHRDWILNNTGIATNEQLY